MSPTKSIYGYSKEVVNEYGLHELKEVSFKVGADDLDLLSRFFKEAAEQLRSGKLREGSHRHIEEVVKGWGKEHKFDVIVLG